jgi:uncharacterized membrane protein
LPKGNPVANGNNQDSADGMKDFRVLLTVGVAAASLICPGRAFARGTGTPPTVVPQDQNDRNLVRDLRGVPDNVKTLIVNFDQVADKYLQQQQALLLRLKNVTTEEQRAGIREQLQDNRQAFLGELKAFRQELRSDLQALKSSISHAEILRILDAARDAAGPLGPRHKGKN